ncbi:hypothetical protein Vadar_019166 [Vaccinium darrowii]|uniref:Uncharacterized protein n=1 Tax=Vaccinium darrowii TaxID=229202 RepID=A0ACB7ZMK9_9ERIC|nr:hypothetical protein Vadar_019166 [Vaccinium darrowii]
MAIWKADIKRETNIPETVVNKVLKALEAKDLVKEVVNVQCKRGKCYIAAEFEPSEEITEDVYESSEFPTKAVAEIMVYMELDKEIIEVTSTGLGKFCSIPKGRLCYRLATGKDLQQGPWLRFHEVFVPV